MVRRLTHERKGQGLIHDGARPKLSSVNKPALESIVFQISKFIIMNVNYFNKILLQMQANLLPPISEYFHFTSLNNKAMY